MIAVIVMAALPITVSQVSATLLTFDYGAPIALVWPYGGNLDQTYGDNVTGSPHGANGNMYGPAGGWTPNVEVSYSDDDPGTYDVDLGGGNIVTYPKDWEVWSGGWLERRQRHALSQYREFSDYFHTGCRLRRVSQRVYV